MGTPDSLASSSSSGGNGAKARTIAADVVRLREKLEWELGSLIREALLNPATQNVALNEDGRLWVQHSSSRPQPVGYMSAEQAHQLIGTLAYLQEHCVVNAEHPFLETDLPSFFDSDSKSFGSRFTGIVPPVVSSPCLAIRQLTQRRILLDEWEEKGALTERADPFNIGIKEKSFRDLAQGKSHREILRLAVEFRLNVLIVGSTESGKTTFAAGVLADYELVRPEARIVIIEELPELQCRIPDHVRLRARKDGPVSLRDCLRVTMRLTPESIVVGEVRGAEAFGLLKAWNSGHPGGLATIHANGALLGLSQLEMYCLESPDARNVPHVAIQSLIGAAVDLVVFLEKDARIPAGRKVRELLLVEGYEHGSGYQTLSV